MVTYFLINGKYITKDTTITVLSVLSITKRTIKTTYLKKSANKKGLRIETQSPYFTSLEIS